MLHFPEVLVQRILQTLVNKADIGQSRTSALNPLQWLTVILGVILLIGIAISAPIWLLISLLCLLVASVLLLLFAFGYFMFANPDALRSEKYVFSKLALEKGLIGDDLVGLLESTTTIAQLPESTAENKS